MFELIAGFVGAIVGIFSWFGPGAAERQRQREQAYYQALDTYNQIEAQISQTELDIAQTEANISAFDQALGRWQSEFDASLMNLQLEGQAQYNTLMENWQGTELAMAATGRVGGSAALVAQQQKAQLEVLTGKDLKLDMNGGTYGSALSSFYLDSLAGLNELTGNRDIAAESLGIYRDALADYKVQLDAQYQVVLNALADVNQGDAWYSQWSDEVRKGNPEYIKKVKEYHGLK